MAVILLEALLALFILIAIVWWTMFHGRQRGELPPETGNARSEEAPPPSAPQRQEAAAPTDGGKVPPFP